MMRTEALWKEIFSSCVETRGIKATETQDNEPEFALSQSEIQFPVHEEVREETDGYWLIQLEYNQLIEIQVSHLRVSDGADIWGNSAPLTFESLQVFGSPSKSDKVDAQPSEKLGMSPEKFYKLCLWYELLKHLSASRIYCQECEGVVSFDKWICYVEDKSIISFALELYADAIVRKLVQIKLKCIATGELNMFLLSFTMYESLQHSNRTLIDLFKENKRQKESLEEAALEREKLDSLLDERDARTRTIVVDLLNEKKKKIVELETKLTDYEKNISDINVINKHIKNAVSELNSPGKRKRKFSERFGSPSSTPSPSSISTDKKKMKRNGLMSNTPSLIKKRNSNESGDGFEEFEYMGINKKLNLDDLDRNYHVKVDEVPNLKKEDEKDGKSQSHIKNEESEFDQFIEKENMGENSNDRTISSDSSRNNESTEETDITAETDTDVETDIN